MNRQVVLITGALTGIGRSTALAFAKDGARIVIAGRRDEAGEELVSDSPPGAEAEFGVRRPPRRRRAKAGR